ncbi:MULTISPECIES: DUF2164 domain-containing protein [Vibrio]|uniref:DUF2164 domain-containing protein n=2 Tax=Vibrio TaxID=662 RepID=A0A1E5CMX5_9VIBR|nr:MULTISPECIES: DUF2164 domain-containing protein [Vibrio]MDN3695809.1 DUF2164 domain-containing protein [Vibrio cortegadensis]NOH83790.1 DUF2164 domain-containing protein [Vibrio sp. 03-59-1]OEE71250.1 hypothetical protein A130_07920 [Vibrio genomosp. F6 str. FF-238]TKF21146.1 DUF2164 domain-containing protein [Vibrio genomosp. F6]
MTEIVLEPKTKQSMVAALQRYFEEELDSELGQFDGEFLLDFLSKKLGPVYYNQGIADAQKVMERKIMDISDELYEIEKIVEV